MRDPGSALTGCRARGRNRRFGGWPSRRRERQIANSRTPSSCRIRRRQVVVLGDERCCIKGDLSKVAVVGLPRGRFHPAAFGDRILTDTGTRLVVLGALSMEGNFDRDPVEQDAALLTALYVVVQYIENR